MKYIILDLDGCISDDRWRLHLIDHNEPDMTKRYEKYHSVCDSDPPINRHLFDSLDEVVRTRGWTKEQAAQYQLNGLLAGEETPVEAVAEFVTFLLSSKERHKYLTGTDIPYGL